MKGGRFWVSSTRGTCLAFLGFAPGLLGLVGRLIQRGLPAAPPQLPFKTPPIPSTTEHKALHGATLGKPLALKPRPLTYVEAQILDKWVQDLRDCLSFEPQS